MTADISIILGQKHSQKIPDWLSPQATASAHKFHQSMPMYKPTPLVSLPELAARLKVSNLFVKDESYRFGLNAFKGLGASFAIAKIISQVIGNDMVDLDFTVLNSESARAKVTSLTMVTATDGNHGKGVAWATNLFGCKAKVFMPKGSKQCRADAIKNINNTSVEITDLNYDDTVRLASKYAEKHGYYLVQDTGFPGYRDIPNYITQGYTTMAKEAIAQLAGYNIEKPTHVFLQAGVGSMAGGVLGYMANYYNTIPPVTTIVEPATVACIFKSVEAGTGTPQSIEGNPETIMAGLNCGEPNPYTWPVLRDYASFYARCSDWVTEYGMKTLAKPIGKDKAIVSGESGAVGTGLIAVLCLDDKYNYFKDLLGLDETSSVLVFSTEGNTDPEVYDSIVNS